MDALFFMRVAPAVVLCAAFVAVPTTSWAGGGRQGGLVLQAGSGIRGAPSEFHGVMGGSPRFGVSRRLPPVSGVIHEHAGMRPSYSAYGRTATALPFVDRGHGGGGTDWGSDGGDRYVNPAVFRRPGFVGRREVRIDRGLASREWRRWAAPRWRYVYGGGSASVSGGDADGDYAGIGGTYGAPGTYGSAGTYGGGGTYGASGTYGRSGIYGGGYVSETPLAARFAEPSLAPGPGTPYSSDERYAYAASEDVGPGPRVIVMNRALRQDCGCGPRVQPIVYRYGVGTAY